MDRHRARAVLAELADSAWIAAHLQDASLRLVELDVSSTAYESGHIPGAVFWNAYSDLRDPDYIPIGTAQLEGLLSRSGITPQDTLVFYGYGAALGFWLMQAHGHRDVRMLAGSRERWAQDGGRWSTEVPSPAPSAYPLARASAEMLASRADVEAALSDPGVVLLDVRSELEFSGERFWPSGAPEDVGRAGHVPGAVSVPINLLLDDDGAPRDAEELRRVLQAAGVAPAQAVISYCTIGNRASQAAFALRYLLDYPDVRVYYPSWVEWGKADGTPVER
ncbi:MAG TPA: rhodanese-like domain-containing protein [Solirubrobacteraceae bacterium]|nr:rhodanese-like domain-containing protein [Solirubrobacteraceae bacterium]